MLADELPVELPQEATEVDAHDGGREPDTVAAEGGKVNDVNEEMTDLNEVEVHLRMIKGQVALM